MTRALVILASVAVVADCAPPRHANFTANPLLLVAFAFLVAGTLALRAVRS